uniref:Uncharacterized protein n=1 Tax=Cucumis melo TaxID=3656 RepID=A0A9I9EHL4_CUCME
MFSIKIDDIYPFLETTILFVELTHKEICLKFLQSTLSIIVRYQSPIFIVMMSMPQPLFAEYSVDRNHISIVSLPPLHNALVDGETFATLNISIEEEQNKIFLTFEASSPSTLPLNRELTFVVPMEDWSPGPVKFDGKIFSIESELFTDIIQLFSAFNEADAILITAFGSKVTFSVPPFAETPLTEEVC